MEWTSTNRFNQTSGPTKWPKVGNYNFLKEYLEDYAKALTYQRQLNIKAYREHQST